MTVTKDSSGRYFLSFVVDTEPAVLPEAGTEAGIGSSASANKGTALARIAAASGVPLAVVAAVGDMPNDLPMPARAGLPVAVANADPSVIAAADAVVGANHEGGVADLLEAMTRARRRGPVQLAVGCGTCPVGALPR